MKRRSCMMLVVAMAVAGSARSPLTAQSMVELTPQPPTGITFSGSGTSVTVAWTASLGAAAYRILRSLSPTTAGTDITKPVATTSVADLYLSLGTTYYYQVVALYPDGRQAASTTAVYSTPVAPRTIALAGFTASGTSVAVAPRTIVLAGFTASGTSVAVAPRTITLAGFTASGTSVAVAPRTIMLAGFTASGTSVAVAPRTISLVGFTAIGTSATVAPRTITLTGWAGVGQNKPLRRPQ